MEEDLLGIDLLDFGKGWQRERHAASGTTCGLAECRFVEEKPCFAHPYRYDRDTGKVKRCCADSGINLFEAVGGMVCLLCITMDKEDIARVELSGKPYAFPEIRALRCLLVPPEVRVRLLQDEAFR
ncbi:MAG: hypothetical protein AAF089_04485 [Bacteroidota bacterium]